MRLSKSRFMAGLQCHRQLWWRLHEPEASELVPDAALQALFDQGAEVGRHARERVPGGILIDLPHTAIAQRVAATEAALRSGARVIYEASFLTDQTFVAVDILERDRRGVWRLVEVKSTTNVKPEHIPDVAVQLHVVRKAGMPVTRAEVMHLNRECAFPHLENLFTRADVTAEAEALLPEVRRQIRRQLEMLRGPLPDVPIGPHCDAPYECPFKDRCWPELPEHHISTLYYVGARRWDLEACGCVTIEQIPEDFPLRPPAERQLRAIREKRVIVEPDLGPALRSLRGPLAVLDFETVATAIPVWTGCHPYDPVPVQFSCHIQDARGDWTHHEWLADGPQDPRPELMKHLAHACRGARTILAYYSIFEDRCLQLIADALPAQAIAVGRIRTRLADALPLVRDHVYHPAFGGSFSLKAVVPALVPELDYAELQIAEGTAASRELERILLHSEGLLADELERVREELRRYCTLDTWGVVRLLEKLHELASAL